MKRSDYLEIAGLNISCPFCGQLVVYELKSNSDIAVCHHCKKEFKLSELDREHRDSFLQLINQIPQF